jgi:hypothetical protein
MHRTRGFDVFLNLSARYTLVILSPSDKDGRRISTSTQSQA